MAVLHAQEVADSIANDSITLESLELVPMQAADSIIADEDTILPLVPYYKLWNDSDMTDVEWRTLDWCLNWLDTTECVAVHDTTILPDSVYKARL